MVTSDFPDSAYQCTHWAFSDAVAIFYARYVKEKKTIEINFFRCSFTNNAGCCECGDVWFLHHGVS
jgi:hypothetical protein